MVDEVQVSENTEAGLVLIGTIGAGVTATILQLPIPTEWKVPLASLSGTISAASLAYWKAKVNKTQQQQPAQPAPATPKP